MKRCEWCVFKPKGKLDLYKHQIDHHFELWRKKDHRRLTVSRNVQGFHKTAGSSWTEERKERALARNRTRRNGHDLSNHSHGVLSQRPTAA